jgi:3-hydroxyacyl-[acyl-carrier-protein] dehydratase
MRLIAALADGAPSGNLAADAIEARFILPATSTIFGGHYPDHPLVPGVYLVEAALQALELAYHRRGISPLHCVGVTDLRLLHAVGPDAPVDLRATAMTNSTTDAGTCWHVAIWSSAKAVARFKLTVSENEPVGPALPPSIAIEEDAVRLSAADVMRLLAHRPPILLVDEAFVSRKGNALAALKAVTLNEPCYAGLQAVHGMRPLAYPAALLIESFVQSAGVLIMCGRRDTGEAPLMLLAGIRRVNVLGEVFPAELVRHELSIIRTIGDATLVSGVSRVGKRAIAEVHELLVALRDASSLRTRAVAATNADQRGPRSEHPSFRRSSTSRGIHHDSP